jgi:outer membrane protein
MQKDGEKLGQTELEKLDLEFRQKARDFQTESKQLNEAKARADREMLESLKPRLDKAVETVLQTGNYDLVIDRSAVVDVKAEYDITRQVIERLNASR